MKKLIKKECIICGAPALVRSETELAACQSDHCIRTVEDSIGLHYAVGIDQAALGKDVSAIVTYQGGEITNVQYK